MKYFLYNNRTLVKSALKTYFPRIYPVLKNIFYRITSRSVVRLDRIFTAQAAGGNSFLGAKVSVICSCFNTSPDHLKAMLDSLLRQVYPNWELCLLNCSDDDHPDVGRILEAYARKDPRIRVFGHANQGIAANSNYVEQFASGEFLLLMDHDDLLPPCALEELMKAAALHSSDFVYADEYYLYPFGYRIRRKKDFDLQLLWHDNYLNHPGLIRKRLFDEIGGFREGFKGSQDYDLYIRLIEKIKTAYHVRKPLYVWRIHDTSFSQKSMEECIASGKKALEEHLARLHIRAEVRALPFSAEYIVKKISD